MKLAGIDLAWQSEKNPSAIAYGILDGQTLMVTSVNAAMYGINEIFACVDKEQPQGVAIDASLIINNPSGQRDCETQIGKVYGPRGASCHSSNTRLYPDARSVYLSRRLLSAGFNHIDGEQWQIECYPHPAIIEMFDLPERLKYKKGKVAEKRQGQKDLAKMLKLLGTSTVLRLVINDDVERFVCESSIETLCGKKLKNNEDVLDSLICLYIAGLHALGHDGRLFGDTTSGYIWVPRIRCA